MPEVKKFEIETDVKTREIMTSAFGDVSAVKMIEDLMKKAQST